MKKINFGIILIILVIIFLIIYIIITGISRKNEEKNIKNILEEYLNIYNKYSVLEEKDRNIDKNIDNIEYNRYLYQMRQDLFKYVSSDKLDKIYEQYKQRLDKQIEGLYVMKEYDKELINIVEYNFNDSYVSVTLNLNITMNRDARVIATKNDKNNRYEGKITNVLAKQRIMELIVLKKIDGQYKIIMHNIIDLDLGYTGSNIPIGGI